MATHRYTFSTLLTLLTIATVCRAADYDFFELSRYPVEAKRRPWVELYKVAQDGNGDPQQYNRRSVNWWPRKGVDFTELRDGMIEREWTLVPSALDPECEAGVIGEVETEELDSLVFTPNAGDSFMRRVRGFITPSESGAYTFEIAADDKGAIYLSRDEDPANARAVCYQKILTQHLRWNRWPTQTSTPQQLEKDKTYYYEVVYVDFGGRDLCDVSWSRDRPPSQSTPRGSLGRPFAGDEFSTLDGRKSKFIVEKWQVQLNHGRPRLPGVPLTFKAHLVGFMGLGNELGEPYQGQDIVAPGVVLRFPNGRKRVLHRGLLSEADQRFAMDLYVKEMNRIKASLDQTEFTADEGFAGVGREFYSSPHFSFNVAAHPKEESAEERAKRDTFYRSAVAGAEYWYAYLEYGGHLMQYWDREEKLKHHVGVGGGNGGGYGGCQIGGISALPIALFHEYSHGFGLWWFGHPEIFCDFGQVLGTGGTRVEKAKNNVAYPHLSALTRSYGTCLFLAAFSEDPNWGYCAPFAMPKADVEQNFFQTFARVAEQRGLCKKGLPGVGDILGDYGARLAEFDFHNHEVLKDWWFSVVRNYLEPIDVKNRMYRIVWDRAPESYGSNVIRLVPDDDAKDIAVDFQGYYDPTTYSDWRACIVAVDKDGLTRYSDLWNKGVMTMPRQEGDRRYWLTVTAAPTGILAIPNPLRMCSGRYAPVYPWRVTLKGARPGTPRRLRFDADDHYASHGAANTVARIHPTPPNTPARKLFVEKSRELQQGVQSNSLDAKDPYVRQLLMATGARMDKALAGTEGAPHANGGGWVAATATVDPTAYVAPGAMVMGFAHVLDHASVEDYAIIRGNARLSGNARVGGEAIVEGETQMSGYQRHWLPDATTHHGLWLNYAMEETPVMMLENRFFEYGVLNGYIHGDPKLIVDGGRRAFLFDGKTQYAELNSRAADLDAITIDIATRPDRNREQTLLDFGSDPDTCMTLKTDSRGRPVFSATVGGEELVNLRMKQPLAKGAWTRLRVEIDGKSIALWANDRLAARTASTFRPGDAFVSGLQKRNLVAASLNGKGHFAGAIDYVVIYRTVHGDKFAGLPPPVLDGSCRPTQRFADELRVDSVARKRYQIENDRAIKEAMLHYNKQFDDIRIRHYDLRHRDPNWPKALTKAREDLANPPKQDTAKTEVTEPPGLAELKKEREAVETKIKGYAEKEKALREGEAEWLKAITDAEYLALKAEDDDGQAQLKKLKPALEASFAVMPEEVENQKKIAALSAERAKLDDSVKTGEEAVKAAVTAMPIYWDAAKIASESSLMSGLKVQYENELQGAKVGAAIQAYREHEQRLEQMATNADYKRAIEIDRELEVLKTLSPVYRETHFAKARDYTSLKAKLDAKESPGRRANTILARLKQERREKALGPEYAPLQEQRTALRKAFDGLRREHDKERRNQQNLAKAAIEEHRAAVKKELFDAYNRAVEPTYAEYHVGVSYMRCVVRGFYNEPYPRYMKSAGLLKKSFRYRAEPGGQMQDAIEAYRPENWKTDVRAWDWRIKLEREGTLSQFPMAQKWLKRVRGDGPINGPGVSP
ncbi:MAG: hypothetical protein HN919_14955 [Verrucomicrobia bacterium]|nr:hypothetical protein [Verrucomicrobiota bacterium]MBT7067597.1 hypothetical protein [Verrucomicrobiota bacterium]MBT7701735.1 hypothetical protein [Verrucomicrobiota bacterium]